MQDRLRGSPTDAGAGGAIIHPGGAGARAARPTLNRMSHSSLLRRTAALSALAATMIPAAAQAAPTRLSTEQGAAPIAAWKGLVAWSRLDTASKQWRLVASDNTAPPALVSGAGAASSAFELDLGSSRQGTEQAVYVRDGRLYRYSFAGQTETRLAKLAPGDVRLPSIQRGEIAFVRPGATSDALQIGNTTSGSKGPRTLLRLTHKAGTIQAVELSWDRVAYVVYDKGPYGFGRERLHVRMLRTGRDRVVYTATSGGANAAHITRPSLTDDQKAFVFARTNTGSGSGNRIVRYDIASGTLSFAPGSSRYFATAYAGPQLGLAALSDDSSTGTCFANINDTPDKTECHVDLTGPLTFAR